jgi:hypothetical protein
MEPWVEDKGGRRRWILHNTAQCKKKFGRWHDGKWDQVAETWSFPRAAFETKEILLRLYNDEPRVLTPAEEHYEALQLATDRKMTRYYALLDHWDKTLTRTDENVKVEVDISGNIVSLLEWAGYVTTPSEEATTEYMVDVKTSRIQGATRTHYGLSYSGGTA